MTDTTFRHTSLRNIATPTIVLVLLLAPIRFTLDARPYIGDYLPPASLMDFKRGVVI